MKRAFVLLIFICLSFRVMGQENNQLNEMIVNCLNTYINHYAGQNIDNGVSDTFLCKDGLPLGFPYDSLSGIDVISIDYLPLSDRCFMKKLKKGVRTLYVYYSLNGKYLQITISERNVKLMKKMKTIELSNFGRYYYEYSCDKRAWELAKTQYDGI